jgi:hypothetical protein
MALFPPGGFFFALSTNIPAQPDAYAAASPIYGISLALRAALPASLQAAGSVSATPRMMTWRLPVITSQYQRSSPLGMTRNSTFASALLFMNYLLIVGQGIKQPAFRRAAISAKEGYQARLTPKRRNLRHRLHSVSTTFANCLICEVHHSCPLR